MYVRHIPSYTGFGLGEDQPIVLLPFAPTGTTPTDTTGGPLVAFGHTFNWTEIMAGLGMAFLAVFAFRGTQRAHSYVSGEIQARKTKAAKRKRIEAQLIEL